VEYCFDYFNNFNSIDEFLGLLIKDWFDKAVNYAQTAPNSGYTPLKRRIAAER